MRSRSSLKGFQIKCITSESTASPEGRLHPCDELRKCQDEMSSRRPNSGSTGSAISDGQRFNDADGKLSEFFCNCRFSARALGKVLSVWFRSDVECRFRRIGLWSAEELWEMYRSKFKCRYQQTTFRRSTCRPIQTVYPISVNDF